MSGRSPKAIRRALLAERQAWNIARAYERRIQALDAVGDDLDRACCPAPVADEDRPEPWHPSKRVRRPLERPEGARPGWWR